MPMVAAELLRLGLLRGTSLLVVGSAEPPHEPPVESFGHAVREACEGLGARVDLHVGAASDDEAAMDAAVASTAAADPGGIDMLVVDGAALFASGGLRACLDSAWDATRAVVNLAFLPATPSPSTRRGIVYLAPAPGSGEQADAARAGLENLARTLSVEWARHAITLVTIALGEATTPGEAAALTAYLASPAGAYFSGAQLDLRGV
jgi:NAD(P)-dependent dehydrogenase (short-subunit alcohol dehydrogenase family)